ncbi:dsDNA nuclease domain-containing protein [Acinetobacter bereziniae]|uniref:dsDNA nuclease domain-containing protein n=1 Tax=Acinetobacter bereziniae TaxID=106648 RepID=UPI000C2CBE1D|nr:dsDNA nuclease domain-containing protein [Acinetobacter bereziniae]ATZ63024.1 hypothetical protein BSR55_06575 [Acinetobacter bereziniae]
MNETNEIIKNLFDTLEDEKTGAQAKRGFRYQDWWCTQKIFSIWATENIKDFALGVEVKEDAVLIDSISSPKSIELYQIKKRENRNWSITDLTRVETQDKSILSKLYSRIVTFPPTDIRLFFITNSSLKAKHDDNKKDIFHTNINFNKDLNQIEKDKIKLSIQKQLNLVDEVDLNKMYFNVSSLPLENTDKHIYGCIYALNAEHKFPFSIKNIHVAANHITHIFNKLSADTGYATNLTKFLSRCLTREQLENIISIVEKNFFDPEETLKNGIQKLERENYPHRKLKKIDLSAAELLLDLRNRSKKNTQFLFSSIHDYYLENSESLDELIQFSSIVDTVANEIFSTKNNGFFTIEYIKCAVIIYDISNGKIYCEKFFNI